MPDKPSYTEQDLLAQIATGDEQAFRIIFDRYKEKLAAFAIKATTSETAAEEIIQEVFIKIWVNREKLVEIEDAGNYFFILTRNKVLDYLRKIARNRRLIEQLWIQSRQSVEDADHPLQVRESQELIAVALSQLTDQKQLIFRLSRVEGLSHEQIAEQLNLSKSRVKNIIVETLKHIKDHLAKHSPSLLIFCSWLFKN